MMRALQDVTVPTGMGRRNGRNESESEELPVYTIPRRKHAMKKKWKRLLLCSMAFTSLCAFTGVPAHAAYTLNPDVANPTEALKQAASIGVCVYENPEMKEAPNKDAIVVMSFGTTYKDSRAKTIDATVQAIKDAHPDTKVVVAFTSHIIVERIKANEGLSIPTPEEALEQLKKEGYTRVAITNLNIIPGMEYDYDRAVFNIYKSQFKKMTLGTPILYWMGQENQRDDLAEFVQHLSSQFPKQGKDDAILLMAHGTPHPANAYYSVLQNRIDEGGFKNVYVYSVEGWPHLDTVIPLLKAKGIKHVTLMPMMMVAGDHANNDMAGAEEDSHKSILEKEGFTVDADIHGLGENEQIRKMFVERANEAWNGLEK